mmetsp:Transcript_28799/g.87105  ORF Transcript_28799/g.87105 Transcript_28799/m.87105 type:complete len:346 (-) Transcript_28799:256-1293(-)
MVVHDEVLDGVEKRMHEAVDRQNFADQARVRDDVQAHVVEFILHQVRNQAEQLALRDIPSQDLRHGAQDLGQRSADRLCGVQSERLELGQNVRLELLWGQRVAQLQARLDDPDGLLPDLLLGVFQDLHEAVQELAGDELGPEGGAELVEVLRDREAHPPGAVLARVLDHRQGVLLVLVLIEHEGHDERGVDARDADGVLRVLLRQLLVHRDQVADDVRLLAPVHQVLHLVGRGAPDHRRVVHAQRRVGLPEIGLLVLVREAVRGRQQGAGGDARGEEIGLGRQSVECRDQVLGCQARFALDDEAQRLDSLVPDDRLLLGRQVFERGDEDRLVPVAVQHQGGVLLR